MDSLLEQYLAENQAALDRDDALLNGLRQQQLASSAAAAKPTNLSVGQGLASALIAALPAIVGGYHYAMPGVQASQSYMDTTRSTNKEQRAQEAAQAQVYGQMAGDVRTRREALARDTRRAEFESSRERLDPVYQTIAKLFPDQAGELYLKAKIREPNQGNNAPMGDLDRLSVVSTLDTMLEQARLGGRDTTTLQALRDKVSDSNTPLTAGTVKNIQSGIYNTNQASSQALRTDQEVTRANEREADAAIPGLVGLHQLSDNPRSARNVAPTKDNAKIVRKGFEDYGTVTAAAKDALKAFTKYPGVQLRGDGLQAQSQAVNELSLRLKNFFVMGANWTEPEMRVLKGYAGAEDPAELSKYIWKTYVQGQDPVKGIASLMSSVERGFIEQAVVNKYVPLGMKLPEDKVEAISVMAGDGAKRKLFEIMSGNASSVTPTQVTDLSRTKSIAPSASGKSGGSSDLFENKSLEAIHPKTGQPIQVSGEYVMKAAEKLMADAKARGETLEPADALNQVSSMLKLKMPGM